MITINCNKRLLAYTFSDSWQRLFLLWFKHFIQFQK